MLTLVAVTAFVSIMAVAYRWLARRSWILSALFLAGIIVRLAGGVGLFLASYYHWPVLRSLQLGDGFWTLALDGRTYFEIASRSAAEGLSAIPSTQPSPLYLRVLAVWLWLFGLSPLVSVLLNIACYIASAILIVAAGAPRGDEGTAAIRGTAVALAALTFSPALLIFGTQPLKDPLCLLFMVAVFVGARAWWAARADDGRAGRVRMLAGGGLMLIGIYGIAGIRVYIALMLIAALAVGAAYGVAIGPGGWLRARDALRQVVLIGALSVVFIAGAGREYAVFQSLAETSGASASPLLAFDFFRDGFTRTAGATALDRSPAPTRAARQRTGEPTDAAADRGAAAADTGVGVKVRLVRIVRGYAVLVVPISLLQAVSFVRMEGGRGLLMVTDIDTVMGDLAAVAALAVVLISLRRRTLGPDVVFALLFAVVTAASLGYVVTNYGTLFRLRLLAITPLWMLPVMAAPERDAAADRRRP